MAEGQGLYGSSEVLLFKDESFQMDKDGRVEKKPVLTMGAMLVLSCQSLAITNSC